MAKNILLELLTDKKYLELKKVLSEYNSVDLLEDMPANVVNHLLDQVSQDTRADINRLLKYPEDSAGSIMTVEYIDVTLQMTVQQTLDKIRTIGIHSETVYTCYVVEKRKLCGIVTAEALLTNDGDTQVKELMEEN